jgi:putative copper export protein
MSYAAIAVAVGGVLFLLLVWLPALREVAGARDGWRLASEAFASSLRRIGALTIGGGVLAAALGIVLQGASAGGTSFWDALDPEVIGDVLGTRAGTAWGLRLLDWALLGALLIAISSRQALPALRPASLGAVGQAARAHSCAVSGCAKAPSGEPQRRRRPRPRDRRRPVRARRPRRPARGAPGRTGSQRRSACGCSSSWASPSRASDAPCG